FSLLAFIRWRDNYAIIATLARYLQRVERVLYHAKIGGWEAYLDRERSKGRTPMISAWYIAFWLVCIMGPFTVAYSKLPPPIGVREKKWVLGILIVLGGSAIILALTREPIHRIRAWRQ